MGTGARGLSAGIRGLRVWRSSSAVLRSIRTSAGISQRAGVVVVPINPMRVWPEALACRLASHVGGDVVDLRDIVVIEPG